MPGNKHSTSKDAGWGFCGVMTRHRQEPPKRAGMCVRLLKGGAQRSRAFRVHGWEPNAGNHGQSPCATRDVTAGEVAAVQP